MKTPINSLFLSICFVLTAPLLRGQFDALLDSNARWMIGYYDGPDLMDMWQYHMGIDPDTLIDGSWYKKLYEGDSDYLSGAVLDDGTGKVYFRSTFHEIALLYDYTVDVGDTIDVVNASPGGSSFDSLSLYISSVDTVLLAGKQRKRIGIALIVPGSPDLDPVQYWIQGIGGTGGLLTTCGCSSISGSTRLECMGANDTIQYTHYTFGGPQPGYPGNCFLLQGVEVLDWGNTAAHPNPSSGLFHLGAATQAVLVYNAQGRLLFTQQRHEVDLGAEPPGVYTTVVETDKGRSVERLVVVR